MFVVYKYALILLCLSAFWLVNYLLPAYIKPLKKFLNKEYERSQDYLKSVTLMIRIILFAAFGLIMSLHVIFNEFEAIIPTLLFISLVFYTVLLYSMYKDRFEKVARNLYE